MNDQHDHYAAGRDEEKSQSALDLRAAYAHINDTDRANRWFAIERALQLHAMQSSTTVNTVLASAEQIYGFINKGFPGIEDPAS